MKRVTRFWKIVLFDTLGVLLIIASPFTGFLPGPGGIPVFLLGLSLLAIHHEWAQRYIDLVKKYADKLGDYIFVETPQIQKLYDILAPLVFGLGVFFLWRHSALWMISFGIFLCAVGLTFVLGNRHRWSRLKKRFKR